MRISKRRKAQLVADALVHRRIPDVEPSELGDWRYYINWIKQDLDNPQLRRQFFAEFGGLSEDDALACEMIRECIKSPIIYPTARQTVEALPDLEWLWKGWLPKRLVSLLAATPGTGKSYLGLDLAQRIITGDEWPDGTAIKTPGPVIYVDAENTPTIFKKRVSVWRDQDLDQLYLMLPEKDRSLINLDEFDDRDRLWDMVWDVSPRLVILDSYGSATLRGENNKEDVQQLLAYLNNVAKQLNTTILIIHHLRKPGGSQTTFLPMTIDSIRGSSHIPAMARNVWGLQWIPTGAQGVDQNGPRRLWVMKSNVGIYPEPVGVFFDTHPDDEDVATLNYGESPDPYQEPTKRDICAEWLEDILRDAEDPIPPSKIVDWGKEEGFSRRTIYRARKSLPISDTSESKYDSDNRWVWNA